jgi:mannose-6-phosphate isomerase-like protein (cupin superfamily)
MAATQAESGTEELEHLVIRFKDLESRKSAFRPRDMLLERFERDRFSVVGRPGEGSSSDKASGAIDAFSVVYARCEPGKGIAAHAHDSSEVFIILSSSWEVSCGDSRTQIEPFDVISVPPGAMHGLVNIGTETGLVMAINEGKAGVAIQLDPAILAELRTNGHEVADPEYPPGSSPTD